MTVSGIVPRADRFSKKGKGVNDYLEVQCKDDNVNFISLKNINPRSHLYQDRVHQVEKGSI